MTYRKKLIEVALPLEAINKASAREKSIRHGHPSTLHLWWARRPLAACRAVLFASLVDDPDSDPAYHKPDGTVDEDRAGVKRAELFNLIEELVQWANSNDPLIIGAARAEIARCIASRKLETGELKKDDKLPGGETVWNLIVKGHGDLRRLRSGHAKLPKAESVNAFLEKYAPPVLDPFCGGGSIPLEAQRLGLRAYASDLNPVAVLITKALIEIPPKFAGKPPVNPKADKRMQWHGAEGLAEDVRYYGKWIRDEAEKRIGHLYPKVKITKEMAKDRPDLKPYVGEELTVIAWLWARTVASPNPAAGGAHVPLVRSFWLSTKKGNETWVRPIIDRKNNTYRFEVGIGKPPPGFDPRKGTIVRTGGTCLLSGSPMPFDHIRAEGKAGRMSARLMAIVAEGKRRRVYLSASRDHEKAADLPLPPHYPDTDLPKQALSMRVMLYGMDKHYKLFTHRQLVALTTFSELIAEVHEKVLADARSVGTLTENACSLADGGTGLQAYADAVATYLAFAQSKACNRNTSLCIWETRMDRLVATFGRQALPMVWDFAETNPLAGAGGDLYGTVESVVEVIENFPVGAPGCVQQTDARFAASVDSAVVSTDPPYYDNIGYADLSDFFYVWLRRSLSTLYPSTFSTLLTPKLQELIASPYRHGGKSETAKSFFEDGLEQAFTQLRQRQMAEQPLTIYYAFKQSEDEGTNDSRGVGMTASTGWETMLAAVLKSGFTVDGTWPIRTEQPKGLRAFQQNSLASSIVLSCRARSSDAPLTTRREFLNTLKRELPKALRNLQRGSIAPVDLAQAAIGPGMAVFTRYKKVMETDGSDMTVRTALGLINQTLDEVLAEQEGEFDADTRWALAWFEQFGMDEGAFGVAETLSKAKNTAINGLVEAGVVKARAGKVRLLRRDEMLIDWDPATDKRLTIWEVTQYLIRMLDQQGESGAATLLRKLGGTAEVARDLAYRLYTICERKKWADEALAYNGLVIAWPELTKLAMAAPPEPRQIQAELF